MYYGYVRVSTAKQQIDRQIYNIKSKYPDAKIYSEIYTGRRVYVRTELTKLLKVVCAGDTIVFDEVSRMSRNAEEGFELYQELYNRGIELIFLKEPQINTNTYKSALESQIQLQGNSVDYILEGINKYLLELAKTQIRMAFEQAQSEVDYLSLRTKEGQQIARKNGKIIGRTQGCSITTKKSIEAKKIIMKHNKSFGGSLDNVSTAELAHISIGSLYKYKREILRELADENEIPGQINVFDYLG